MRRRLESLNIDSRTLTSAATQETTDIQTNIPLRETAPPIPEFSSLWKILRPELPTNGFNLNLKFYLHSKRYTDTFSVERIPFKEKEGTFFQKETYLQMSEASSARLVYQPTISGSCHNVNQKEFSCLYPILLSSLLLPNVSSCQLYTNELIQRQCGTTL